ncbi:MAG: hypothetical protein KF789_06090 [Bdellovibrionaceae bacterium]|nr:hypothetical protein [Pseudobdellovibrionaceae bacterium]
MSSSTWQDHFKEQLVGLEPPREGSFLEMALSEGRITEKDYLQWASETHSIPMVSPQFFIEMQPDPALLEKASLPWRSTFFPVAEWDGHLIVAGLERPLQLPPTCSFVLATRENLSLWWEQLAEHSNPLEGPDGIDLGVTSDESLDLPSFDSAPSAAPSLSFAGISVATPVLKVAEEAPLEPAEAIVVEPASSPSIPSLDPVASVATTPTPAPAVEPFANTASSLINVADISEQTQTRTFISLEPTPIPAAPKQPIPLKNNPTLEKHSLSETLIEIKGYKMDVQKTLTLLAGAYPKVMMLVFDEARKSLIPLMWSETFVAPSSVPRIPLGSASMFEIVASTEKSFHGPVIPNEINTQFLTVWNEGAQPGTMTIVPLIGGGHPRGMILGIGPQSSYTMAILRYAEKVSNDLMKTWKLENHNAA